MIFKSDWLSRGAQRRQRMKLVIRAILGSSVGVSDQSDSGAAAFSESDMLARSKDFVRENPNPIGVSYDGYGIWVPDLQA